MSIASTDKSPSEGLTSPPSPGMDPAQAKMMRYMPLIFMVFLYNFSAGLTLYWTVQNLFFVVQMYLTRNQADAPLVKVPKSPQVAKRKSYR